MGNAYRLDQIYNILLKKKSSTVEDLADSFHVTPTTIRRDLLELEEQGLICPLPWIPAPPPWPWPSILWTIRNWSTPTF